MGIGLYINADFIRSTRNTRLKKQAKIIFITILPSLFFGSMTDLILPLLHVHIIPNLNDTVMLIYAFWVVYAIVKYKFLAFTPATAASNIISTMYDCLILLDMEGNIVTVNKATWSCWGTTK